MASEFQLYALNLPPICMFGLALRSAKLKEARERGARPSPHSSEFAPVRADDSNGRHRHEQRGSGTSKEIEMFFAKFFSH
jgi:hypothetical protein